MSVDAPINSAGAAKASAFWSNFDLEDNDKGLYAFPFTRDKLAELVFSESTGTPDWCETLTVKHYLADRVPFAHALSICCGFGAIERWLAQHGVATRITGVDFAEGAIAAARERAAAISLDSLEYLVGDINTMELPGEEYDLVWCNGGLQHLERLEHVVPMLYRAMRPGGVLVCNEFVGPQYNQLPPEQVAYINKAIRMLPPELRGPYRKKTLLHRILGRIDTWLFRTGIFENNTEYLFRPWRRSNGSIPQKGSPRTKFLKQYQQFFPVLL